MGFTVDDLFSDGPPAPKKTPIVEPPLANPSDTQIEEIFSVVDKQPLETQPGASFVPPSEVELPEEKPKKASKAKAKPNKDEKLQDQVEEVKASPLLQRPILAVTEILLALEAKRSADEAVHNAMVTYFKQLQQP